MTYQELPQRMHLHQPLIAGAWFHCLFGCYVQVILFQVVFIPHLKCYLEIGGMFTYLKTMLHCYLKKVQETTSNRNNVESSCHLKGVV